MGYDGKHGVRLSNAVRAREPTRCRTLQLCPAHHAELHGAGRSPAARSVSVLRLPLKSRLRFQTEPFLAARRLVRMWERCSRWASVPGNPHCTV